MLSVLDIECPLEQTLYEIVDMVQAVAIVLPDRVAPDEATMMANREAETWTAERS
jgi:hypothetical protein